MTSVQSKSIHMRRTLYVVALLTPIHVQNYLFAPSMFSALTREDYIVGTSSSIRRYHLMNSRSAFCTRSFQCRGIIGIMLTVELRVNLTRWETSRHTQIIGLTFSFSSYTRVTAMFSPKVFSVSQRSHTKQSRFHSGDLRTSCPIDAWVIWAWYDFVKQICL